jgi:hypothetical protein
MGSGRDDAFYGHDHRGVGQSRNGASVHEPGSLGVIMKKGHRQCRVTVDCLDDFNVQKPLKRRTGNPPVEVEFMRTGKKVSFLHVETSAFKQGSSGFV